jgi:2'-5' RNA ligase
MARGVAIVAIPSDDDYVWKLSSEEIPHMTLLYLGEAEEMDEVDAAAYIAHVVKTSMHRFGMEVARRGTLGDDEADVLFFAKYNCANLEEIRSYLLAEPGIRYAYETAEQFPGWVPHLTMGYPDDPAKPDERDYPGVTWVNFDRLALWIDDFEGPEFPLPDNCDDEMRMSDDDSDDLYHFGVKGMQWGVRKSSAKAAARASGGSEDHANAAAAKMKAKKGGVKSLSNKELQDMITRMNLEQQYVRLAPPSKGAVILRKGSQVVGEILLGVGKSQATKALNDQATKLIAQAIKK